ncbi:MAG: glycosyl hydrolase family 28-related protein [Verrucomicrobiota bacterium]
MVNTRLKTYLGLALAFGSLFAPTTAQAEESYAWIADLTYPSEDLVPVVSFDVTAAPYHADRLGKKDSTAAFQEALSDANQRGGTVFAPAGRYRIDGNLEIPAGVTLRGDFRKPTSDNIAVFGTVLLAFAGRGDADGKAFISVKEGGLRDLSILYPEQTITNIVPYPTTVDLGGNSAIKNVNLLNAYRGIVTGSFSTVINVYGSPLDVGIVMLRAAAVPRCNGVRFAPHYWASSGLPGAPELEALTRALADRDAHAIQLNRQDAGIFIDINIANYPTAVKVMPPHGWTYWHDVYILNADVGFHFTGGSNHRVNITGSRIFARRAGILMSMDKSDWDPRWARYSKSGKEYGLARDSAELRLFDCEFRGSGNSIRLDGTFRQKVDVQNCLFESWGSGQYAIDAIDANVDVFDSVFSQSRQQVRVDGRASQLNLFGNQFAGKPDLDVSSGVTAQIDHESKSDRGQELIPLQPVPNTLPSRVGTDSLYIVTEQPFNAPNDGKSDAAAAIQKALDTAGRDGGGTVYLPQGHYLITSHLRVPSGVELRGVNDFMPRGKQVRTMLVADIPGDVGKPDNPPLISLESSEIRGGSGVSGVTFWYPNQDYREIRPYPWTVRSLGPQCWVRRIYMGNCYNGIDFASHNSDRHVLSRVNGSALNIGIMVGQTPTIGWIDNCHIRPQDWALSTQKGLTLEFPGENKPDKKAIFRGTPYSLIPNMRGNGAITIGSGANEQITGYFTNGSTRAFDFVDHKGTGGGNANILIGGSEAGWGAWIQSLGDRGVTFVNFSINPMTRLPYVSPEDIPEGNLPKGMVMRIDPSVPQSTPINMTISKFYGRDEVELGFDVSGGTLAFKQMEQVHDYGRAAVEINGGIFTKRNISIGEELNESSEFND